MILKLQVCHMCIYNYIYIYYIYIIYFFNIYIYQFWVAKPQAGATVAAVATRRPKRWAELIALARKSAGTLLLPVSPQSGEVKNDEDGDGCWDGCRRMVTWWRNMPDIFQRPLNGWWNWPIQSDDLALIKTIWSKDLSFSCVFFRHFFLNSSYSTLNGWGFLEGTTRVNLCFGLFWDFFFEWINDKWILDGSDDWCILWKMIAHYDDKTMHYKQQT